MNLNWNPFLKRFSWKQKMILTYNQISGTQNNNHFCYLDTIEELLYLASRIVKN
jgi:hypothetical protein